nr:MAG TPA: hypothetical protein [Caudoviricetes sp.]
MCEGAFKKGRDLNEKRCEAPEDPDIRFMLARHGGADEREKFQNHMYLR